MFPFSRVCIVALTSYCYWFTVNGHAWGTRASRVYSEAPAGRIWRGSLHYSCRKSYTLHGSSHKAARSDPWRFGDHAKTELNDITAWKLWCEMTYYFDCELKNIRTNMLSLFVFFSKISNSKFDWLETKTSFPCRSLFSFKNRSCNLSEPCIS